MIGINLRFGGSLGVLVLGALFAAAAAYGDGYFNEPSRFDVLFWLGVVVMWIGAILTAISTYTWWQYWQRKIELMPYD